MKHSDYNHKTPVQTNVKFTCINTPSSSLIRWQTISQISVSCCHRSGDTVALGLINHAVANKGIQWYRTLLKQSILNIEVETSWLTNS